MASGELGAPRGVGSVSECDTIRSHWEPVKGVGVSGVLWGGLAGSVGAQGPAWV